MVDLQRQAFDRLIMNVGIGNEVGLSHLVNQLVCGSQPVGIGKNVACTGGELVEECSSPFSSLIGIIGQVCKALNRIPVPRSPSVLGVLSNTYWGATLKPIFTFSDTL